MHYLFLFESSTFSLVCKKWRTAFNKIWYSYDYFGSLYTGNFSPFELRKVCLRSSAMPHIKCLRYMLQGKNLNLLLGRQVIKAQIEPANGLAASSMKLFSVKPKRDSFRPLLTDSDLKPVIRSSYNSLQVLSLKSCSFLTGSSFILIGQCKNLQFLEITNNCQLNDPDLLRIIFENKGLTHLNVSRCQSLSKGLIQSVVEKDAGGSLFHLDISFNASMVKNASFRCWKGLQSLRSLSLSNTPIETESLEIILLSCKDLSSIFLESRFFSL